MKSSLRLIVLTIALACMATSASASQGELPLRLVANTPLPGPSNRFDYASLDPVTKLLFIAHMDAGELLVFDVKRRKVVRAIRAPGVHGVIAVPHTGRVYASATDAHELYTVDAATGKLLAHAPAGSYPDGLAYDPVERRVFVSDESEGIEAVFTAAGRRVGTVQLGGEAGNVQYDARSRKILVDVQSRDELAVIDPHRLRVVRRVGLPGCEHDHGLNLDLQRRLAFVACDGNAALLTLDLDRMKVLATNTVGQSPDVLALDTALHRLYVAAESGEVAIFQERGRRLAKLGQAELAPEAHTVAVDARTHLVYFPLERGSDGRPQLRIMAPTSTHS